MNQLISIIKIQRVDLPLGAHKLQHKMLCNVIWFVFFSSFLFYDYLQ